VIRGKSRDRLPFCKNPLEPKGPDVPILLGLDTGGTYTDAVLFDPKEGVLASAKALTTKHNLSIGLKGAIEKVLPHLPAGVAPAEIALVSMSTTLATNAIVEAHGAPICLILAGYDAKALERANLKQALGSDPVVFIAGGHKPSGDEQAPLDLEARRRRSWRMRRRSRLLPSAAISRSATRRTSSPCAISSVISPIARSPAGTNSPPSSTPRAAR
jgi:hypothetical protein